MKYDKEVLFEKAKKVILENNLFFVEDIISMLPISKATFYSYYPIDSNELNELRDLLDENKINLKVQLRKKWFDSDNATLQMGLMKLICTTEEHKKLQQTYSDHTTDGEKINQVQIFQLPDNNRD